MANANEKKGNDVQNGLDRSLRTFSVQGQESNNITWQRAWFIFARIDPEHPVSFYRDLHFDPLFNDRLISN
jgi:hypothetical protein